MGSEFLYISCLRPICKGRLVSIDDCMAQTREALPACSMSRPCPRCGWRQTCGAGSALALNSCPMYHIRQATRLHQPGQASRLHQLGEVAAVSLQFCFSFFADFRAKRPKIHRMSLSQKLELYDQCIRIRAERMAILGNVRSAFFLTSVSCRRHCHE